MNYWRLTMSKINTILLVLNLIVTLSLIYIVTLQFEDVEPTRTIILNNQSEILTMLDEQLNCVNAQQPPEK
jgi:hypothetical protein